MIRLIVIAVVLALVAGVPVACNKLLGKLNTSTVTGDLTEIAASLEAQFGIGVPPGYKGAFALDTGILGVHAASIVTLVPETADPAQIFEGGKSVKFNPGEHTILIAIRSHASESEEKSRRDLQRIVLGESAEDEMTEVFISAGNREIAAYEHRGRSLGQQNFGYLLFLGDGGLIYLSGPATGFDHEFKEGVAGRLAAAYPANELLYSHVQPPQRDPYHPCGIDSLPDTFEIHAVGIRSGSHRLEGIAIDLEDDVVGEQSVAVGRTAKPVLLVLMSGDPTVWRLISTPEARIAGVIASGNTQQRVLGLDDAVPLREIDPHDGNACAPFFATDTEGYEYERFTDRIWEVFAQGVTRMHVKHAGDYFRIGEMTDQPVARGSRSLEDVALDPAQQLLPGKLGLAQLRQRGVLRPARPADLDSWLAELESRGDFDPIRYRRRLDTNLRMQKAFVVTDETEVPPGMYGAHSALFLVASGVPDPTGDLGHNTFLYADGRCAGPACP